MAWSLVLEIALITYKTYVGQILAQKETVFRFVICHGGLCGISVGCWVWRCDFPKKEQKPTGCVPWNVPSDFEAIHPQFSTSVNMINEQLLEILRCPLNPKDTPLQQEGNQLVCPQCNLRFKIKDGFPILVKEEAILPPGCESLADLLCQRDKR